MIDEIPDYNSSYCPLIISRYFENACRKTEVSFLLLRIVDTEEGKGWQKNDHSNYIKVEKEGVVPLSSKDRI